MKTKFLVVILVFSLLSCKKEKENKIEQQEAAVIEEVVNPNFNLEITAIASKKDDFAVYFTEDNTINFSGEDAVWAGIEPTKESIIHFEIPDERIPSHIRLDFGLNKEQDSVVVKNIKVNYLKSSFEFKGSEMFQYFNQNEEFKTEVNTSNGTLTIYKDGSEYKTPFFYPNDNLVNKIKELLIASQE